MPKPTISECVEVLNLYKNTSSQDTATKICGLARDRLLELFEEGRKETDIHHKIQDALIDKNERKQ